MSGIPTSVFKRLAMVAAVVVSLLATGSPYAAGATTTAAAGAPLLYDVDYGRTVLGAIPAGWRDLIDDRANPSWSVDGFGLLRTVVKNYEGLLVYEGALADGMDATKLADGGAEVTFKKAIDETVSVTVVGRLQDAKNYYAACFRGFNKVELIKVKDGQVVKLVDFVTRENIGSSNLWRLRLETRGEHLTARVLDEGGVEQARLDALDADFKLGRTGLRATEFAAAQGFRVMSAGPLKAVVSGEEIEKRNAALASARGVRAPAVVKPAGDVAVMNTPFDRLADDYDVIVAGGGTGGSAAAVQATRLGARVLLIEESDWIGGQMSAAAVTTMDEEGIWFQFPVRERGFYRDFHESMVNFYYSRQMDPFRAYSSHPHQTEGGYEPKVTRAVLYGLIDDARRQGSTGGKPGVLDVSPRTRVTKTRKDGDSITGVTVETFTDDADGAPKTREVACRVLIEATEYGDVLPLTGARYRVGSVTGDNLRSSALMQDNTWSATIREYPEGIPDHLLVKSPPPGYEKFSRVFNKYKLWGNYVWGAPGKGLKGTRDWRVWVHWRGMADSDGPVTGEASEFRHTQCGINGGNDYPMTVGALENPSERLEREREGIYRTLSAIYYFQNEGLKWALAEDEGYNTPYNRRAMKRRDLRPDLYDLAVHMPQWPYVRESRRGVGVYTLRAADMGRFDNAKHWPTSVAMGDYFMDLHRTEEELEADLDPGSWEKGDFAKGGGPFQVPFEVFIPEKIDGLVFAEKNIAQSRLVSGATRLQPITMLTGQAAGAIAGLAATRGVQPRELRAVDVQRALLNAGSTLVPRWYVDVPWGTQVWRDSQLLSLYGILDRPAPIHRRNGPLREKWAWGPDEPVAASDVQLAIARLADPTAPPTPLPNANAPVSELKGPINRAELTRVLSAANANWRSASEKVSTATDQRVTRREFAAVCADILSMPR